VGRSSVRGSIVSSGRVRRGELEVRLLRVLSKMASVSSSAVFVWREVKRRGSRFCNKGREGGQGCGEWATRIRWVMLKVGREAREFNWISRKVFAFLMVLFDQLVRTRLR
jgi:hypothetical protein